MTDLSSWTPRPTPGLAALHGRLVRLEPLDWDRHGEELFAAIGGADRAEFWRHMPVGPFAMAADLQRMFAARYDEERWRTLAVCSLELGRVVGSCSYMRIREAHGSCEVGCVTFGPELARTTAATETLRLVAAHAFELGYRRFEWKCNDRNEASKRAAERFGFTFEGVFRNDMVMKGTSRDTAWYSIIDREWPALDESIGRWMEAANFGPDGAQRRSLASLRSER